MVFHSISSGRCVRWLEAESHSWGVSGHSARVTLFDHVFQRQLLNRELLIPHNFNGLALQRYFAIFQIFDDGLRNDRGRGGGLVALESVLIKLV